MQKSDNQQVATSAHRKVRSSTTLNRRYVKKPTRKTDVVVTIKRSPRVKHFNTTMSAIKTQPATQLPNEVATPHPMQALVNEKMKNRSSVSSAENKKLSAKELKDQAIKKALAAASKTTEKERSADEKAGKLHFGFGRILLAMSCAAAAVFAIVYFVNLNMPDLSLRVAAMQTGINASYPSYVPRDFSLSDITSEEGKITLNFKNSSSGDAFSLIEETSSWDSNALLTNYVKDAYNDNYTVIREQGITLYVNNSDATWVNGGVLYKLKTLSGSLTKKQIKAIAVSL